MQTLGKFRVNRQIKTEVSDGSVSNSDKNSEEDIGEVNPNIFPTNFIEAKQLKNELERSRFSISRRRPSCNSIKPSAVSYHLKLRETSQERRL